MAARKRAELDELPAGLVDEVEALVRAQGAVPVKKLTKLKLTRRAEALLHEKLAQRGLERTATAMRVALREQVAARLDPARPVPVSALGKQVAGARASELPVVLADLARAGRAAIVVRGGKDHVVGRSADVLAAADAGELRDLAKALAAALGKAVTSVKPRAGKPPRALWRPDVVALFDELRARLAPATEPVAAARRGGDPVTIVVGAVERQVDPVTGLASVPEVARALGGALEARAFRDALLQAAAAGQLELRPESGVGLLSAADAALCPRGPDGSPLSAVRLLE